MCEPKRKRYEGEYYRKLAVPFIAAINVVTRCGPAMNRLLRLRERLEHGSNECARSPQQLQLGPSCPCNAQFVLDFKSLWMCSLISTRQDLMSVETDGRYLELKIIEKLNDLRGGLKRRWWKNIILAFFGILPCRRKYKDWLSVPKYD